VIPNDGRRRRRSSSPNRSASNVSGASTTTQRPASFPNIGPARTMVGIATRDAQRQRDAKVRVQQADRG